MLYAVFQKYLREVAGTIVVYTFCWEGWEFELGGSVLFVGLKVLTRQRC